MGSRGTDVQGVGGGLPPTKHFDGVIGNIDRCSRCSCPNPKTVTAISGGIDPVAPKGGFHLHYQPLTGEDRAILEAEKWAR